MKEHSHQGGDGPRRTIGSPARRGIGLLTATAAVLALTTAGPVQAAPTAARAAAAACTGIPVTNAITRDATTIRNFQNEVNKPANARATFCFKAGVYRLFTVNPRANQSFIGEPGVILSGAEVLDRFEKDPTGNRWFAAGRTQNPDPVWNGACRPGQTMCRQPHELFVNNQRHTPVASLAEVKPGTWFFDYGADRIYLGINPAAPKVTVETSVEPFAFRSDGAAQDGVTIANLVVEKYSTFGHMSVIGQQYPGTGWLVRDTEVRLNHAGGITLKGGQALNNFVHHNGHQGISGSGGTGTRVEGNEISFNNTAGYDFNTEGGAGKFSETTGLIYRGNYVHDNYGFGPWTDAYNREVRYENNIIDDNEGPGIMHEISFSAEIVNNVLHNNGTKGTVDNASIMISSSSGVVVAGNTIVVGPQSGVRGTAPEGRMGIYIQQDDRWSQEKCGGWCAARDNVVENNRIRYVDRLRYLGSGAGLSGTGVGVTPESPLMPVNNVFRGNTYSMPDCTEARWHWVDGAGVSSRTGWAAWHGQHNNDATGRCNSDS